MDADGAKARRGTAAILTIVGALLLVGANVVAGLRETGHVTEHGALGMLAPLGVGILCHVLAYRVHPVRGGTTGLLLWTAGVAALVVALFARLSPEADALQPLFLRSLVLGGAVVALALFRRGALARLKHEAGP